MPTWTRKGMIEAVYKYEMKQGRKLQTKELGQANGLPNHSTIMSNFAGVSELHAEVERYAAEHGLPLGYEPSLNSPYYEILADQRHARKQRELHARLMGEFHK